MITFKEIPIWGVDNTNLYYRSYMSIINNFKRCCNQNLKIAFIDNTYWSGPDVVECASNYDHCIIFSLVDPPYTWHYLQELLGDKTKYILVGTDAPDIPAHFWLIYALLEFPNYSDKELLPKKMKVFLSYNKKPHLHRINLIKCMESRGLDALGILTTENTNIPGPETNDEMGLGDMSIWQSHFLNISNETIFRINPELIMSEKTFKPIIGLRPFVINGSPRYYDILEEWGIDFFDDLFPIDDLRKPESSLEALMNRNHNIICDIIEQLQNQNLEFLYYSILPRLIANRNRLKEIMIKEHQRLCVNDIFLDWKLR